jgi:hypothetical protein
MHRPIPTAPAASSAPKSAPGELLLALDKLDAKATCAQGALELKAFLDAHGPSSLPIFVAVILKNLRRSLSTQALQECVGALASCATIYPGPFVALHLAKAVAAMAPLLGHKDVRGQHAVADALGTMAAACSCEPAVDSGPFGSTPGQRLAPFFCKLFALFAEPGREVQEGAAHAVCLVLKRAAPADAADSVPALIPKLLRVLGGGSSVGATAHASLGALEAVLQTALGSVHAPLVVSHATQIAACVARGLAAPDFRARRAAAETACPLLAALAADDADEASPSLAAACASLRPALEKIRCRTALP